MQPVTSPTPSNTSSFMNVTGIGEGNDTLDEERVCSLLDGRQSPEPSIELLVLDSLFSVVKHLPGLTREKKSGYYYVQGSIEASDQESLYNYTKRIGELTLGAEPGSEPRLSPHLLTRIAQHQDPNKPLFPHLHHLRIVRTSSSLNFLHPLLSAALTTLELTAIPADGPFYSSVLSFLECATHQAPRLSTLVLGPGKIEDQILDMSWRYKNLQCLKLLDVRISITDQFLHNIGSLQHLETFVIRNDSTSTYKRSPAVPVLNEPDKEEMSFHHDAPESTSAANANVSDADKQIIGSALFSALRTFEVDGIFDLIEDLVAKITSPDLRALSINITKPLERMSEGIPKPSSSALKGKKGTPSSDASSSSLERTSKEISKPSPFALKKGTPSSDASSSSLERTSKGIPKPSPFALKKGTPSSDASSSIFGASSSAFGASSSTFGAFPTFHTPSPAFDLPPLPPAPAPIPTTDIMTLLRHSTQKWPNTLVSVSLKNDGPSSFLLPPDVFGDLLLRPDMKHLEITGMDIDSMGGTLLRLVEVADSKLEDLYLPVHFNAPDISPAHLRDIAEACSRLKSLRCQLRTWDLNPSDTLVSPPLSHQLEVLSIRTGSAQLAQHLSLRIARFLDSIFPRLKSIKTHNEDGNNTEQWVFIFDLVKSYQAVRMDEHQRLGL